MKFSNFVILSFLMMSCTQNAQVFRIETTTIKKDLVQELKQIKNLKKEGSLYSDSKYEIWSTCDGEWGGKVYFKNKESAKTFVTPATCAVSVNKIGDTYYISNSLAHLTGSCDILEVVDPEKLNLYGPDKKTSNKIIVAGSENLSTEGSKKIVHSSNVLIRTSFVYNNKLYSILTDNDREKSTISEIQNNKFHTVKELPNDLFYHDPIIIKDKDNHQKIYFQSPKSGIFEITDNQIKITYYEK